MPVFKEAGGNINDWYVWGIDVLYPEKRKGLSFLFFRKGYLELLGVQLCGFSEVTSGLVIGFLFFGLKQLFYLWRTWFECNSVH